MKRVIFIILLVVFIGIIFSLAFRGNRGNPFYFQNEHDTRLMGPFEASNSTSRYALTESIVKNNTFTLTEKLAAFSSPDVVDYHGKYLSIFTPGVSLIGVPFYYLGMLKGIPQLATYFSTILFAVVNTFLIAVLAKKLGGSFYTSLISGFIFLFATNALPYALTFTQHHFSVTFILLALLISLRKNSFINNLLFGAILGASILIDIPNIFFLAPISIYYLSKSFKLLYSDSKLKISINPFITGLIIGLFPFIAFFAFYNIKTTGSYTKIGQTLGRSSQFKENPLTTPQEINESKKKNEPSSSSLPFNTRLELNGFYILIISNERAWLYYSPVLYVGLLGLYIGYKKKKTQTLAVIIISSVSINIVLYSMFGDPWGGWAFGPRYLIPSAALLSCGIGVILERYKKRLLFILFFILLFAYSIFINSIGALTTNNIPPKVEAVALPKPIPYTYMYNLELLDKNQSSSLIFNLFLQGRISARTYTYIFFSSITFLGLVIYGLSFLEKENK